MKHTEGTQKETKEANAMTTQEITREVSKLEATRNQLLDLIEAHGLESDAARLLDELTEQLEKLRSMAGEDSPEPTPRTGRDEYNEAVQAMADTWVPACGGTEIPARALDGRRYLYVFNPARAQSRVEGPCHGWLCLETDVVQFESPYGV